MKTIWKYKLHAGDTCSLSMPAGAEVLTTQVQAEEVCIWALVDDQAKEERRTFCVYGTGHPIKTTDPLLYVGTFQLMGGSLVFHVFELI